MEKIKQPVQFFTRTVYAPAQITTSSTVDTFGALQFNLNQIPNVAEFTALYDQYQIKGIQWTLLPRWNSGEGGDPTVVNNNLISPVFTVLDYDDATAPSSLDDLMQYQNLKQTRNAVPHRRYFKPQVLISNYRTALTTGYAPKKNQWLDIAQPDIPHFGLKYGIPVNGESMKYDVMVKYYLAFKNVR